MKDQLPALVSLLLIAPMALEKGQSCLHKNFPNEIFVDPLTLLFAFWDQLGEVSSLAILHYNIQSCLFLVYDLIKAPDNILMFELPQNIDLIDQLMYLFFSQLTIIDFFPHHFFLARIFFNKRNLSKSSLANILFDQFVLFHFIWF